MFRTRVVQLSSKRQLNVDQLVLKGNEEIIIVMYQMVQCGRDVAYSRLESLYFFPQTALKNYKNTPSVRAKMSIFYDDLHALVLDYEMTFESMAECQKVKYLKTVTRNYFDWKLNISKM